MRISTQIGMKTHPKALSLVGRKGDLVDMSLTLAVYMVINDNLCVCGGGKFTLYGR